MFDTHCHIHEADYPGGGEAALTRAHATGVTQMICVGTSEESSREAVEFAALHNGVYAAVGVHPHETKEGYEEVNRLLGLEKTKIVAVGEIGLDYFYTHSPRETQIRALEMQIDWALQHDLPIIFHVREAFDDFWPVFDNFHGIRGELHSFTDTVQQLERGLTRGLLVGVNGISTFTKDTKQQAMFASIPLERMLLETDAPFLTPAPLRGKVNEPAFVVYVAKFHAEKRGISLEELTQATTANAEHLFSI
jgi:TatD DNase family protein